MQVDIVRWELPDGQRARQHLQSNVVAVMRRFVEMLLSRCVTIDALAGLIRLLGLCSGISLANNSLSGSLTSSIGQLPLLTYAMCKRLGAVADHAVRKP